MPENTDTPNAKRTKPGGKNALKVKLWRGVLKAETLLDNDDPHLSLKAINSLATIGGVYAKVILFEHIEQRVRLLEEAQNQKGKL